MGPKHAQFITPDTREVIEERIRDRLRQLSEHAPVDAALEELIRKQEYQRAIGADGGADEAG